MIKKDGETEPESIYFYRGANSVKRLWQQEPLWRAPTVSNNQLYNV